MNFVGKNQMLGTLSRGLISGLRTTWTLSKIVFPITLVLVILQHTPLVPMLVKAVAPLMGFIGLRGEAAIPLVLGTVLNLYAAIAGVLSMELTVKEVFIIAIMISFAHNMFVESGVALKVGVKLWVILLVRFGLGIVSATLINLFWHGGNNIAVYGMAPAVTAAPVGWLAIAWLGFSKAAIGILQLAVIVIPLMVLTQILKDQQYLQKLSTKAEPLMTFLGIRPNATLTLLAGFFMGLVYGAGVMTQAVKEDGVTYKDATLTMIFLMGCHAIVEDTLLFVPLGISIWPLLGIRLVLAIVLTVTVSHVWSKFERQEVAPVGPEPENV